MSLSLFCRGKLESDPLFTKSLNNFANHIRGRIFLNFDFFMINEKRERTVFKKRLCPFNYLSRSGGPIGNAFPPSALRMMFINQTYATIPCSFSPFPELAFWNIPKSIHKFHYRET